jgi:predicted RNase H-like HicB family nuclease
MKYAYPAVFTKEDDGYSVIFPDIDGCATGGATLPEALEMAEDALCLMLYDHEEDGEEIPTPSDLKAIQADEASFVSMVCCDTVEYRKLYDNRAVKKTLTIPNWLNTLAERAGVNFSMTLQTALKQQLNIQ